MAENIAADIKGLEPGTVHREGELPV